MGLTLFEPAPVMADERRREQAVQASGALLAQGDAVLQEIVARARKLFGTGMAAISILHSDWQYVIAATGLPLGAYSRRTSFCGHMVTETRPVFCVPDARRDPRFAGNPVVDEEGGVRFYAGAAIRDEARVVLGALCVFDPAPRDRCPPLADDLLVALANEAYERLQALRPPTARVA